MRGVARRAPVGRHGGDGGEQRVDLEGSGLEPKGFFEMVDRSFEIALLEFQATEAVMGRGARRAVCQNPGELLGRRLVSSGEVMEFTEPKPRR